jgi:hypothetical protein
MNFEDARRSHHRRILLAFGESSGTASIGVNARKAFAIAVKNGYLPVAVLAPLVRSKTRDSFFSDLLLGGPARFGLWLGLLLQAILR